MLPEKLQRFLSNKKAKRERQAWKDAGRPSPPPGAVKRRIIEVYRRKRQLSVFVETGTLHGDTVWALLYSFDRLYSIESNDKLYQNAVKRFQKHRKVRILQGSSSTALGNVVPKLRQRALFWLNGHLSSQKKGAIMEELDHILSSGLNHVILIDEASRFMNEEEYKDYPAMSSLKEYILSRRPQSSFKVKDDIIRIKLRSNLE